MASLVALDLGPSEAFVAALARVWEQGKAALPVDQRLPPPARARLFDQLKPTEIWDTTKRTVLLDNGVEVEDGTALVVTTSGTSGDPKGVVLSMEAVEAAAAITSEALEASTETDRWLLCLPVAHLGGLSVVFRSLLTGVALTVLPRFERGPVEAAAARGATLVSLVPAALSGLNTDHFRKVLLGGSAMPKVRPSNTIATYGMTETAGGIVYDGHSLSGVEIRIEDDEIHLRTPTMFSGYRLRETPELVDGWLATGDLGRLSEEGVLTVLGRRDDLIVSGGNNVFPGPVEQALRHQPLIADVAVVGRPDPRWGFAVTAIVVPVDRANPPTLDAVRGWAKAQLPNYAAPTRLELVDSLPRTTLGKLVRHRL